VSALDMQHHGMQLASVHGPNQTYIPRYPSWGVPCAGVERGAGDLETGAGEAVRQREVSAVDVDVHGVLGKGESAKYSLEVVMLEEIYDGKKDQLINMLAGQLSIIKQQAQVYLGLCGLALTVTGFSGGNVIRSGSLASGFLVAGIVFIYIAAVISIFAVGNIKWITQIMVRDTRLWIHNTIERRDLFQRYLFVSATALGIGLVCYLSAVSIAAVRQGDQLKVT